jgi:hypothetical protein
MTGLKRPVKDTPQKGVVEILSICGVSLYPRAALNKVVKINFREELYCTAQWRMCCHLVLLLPYCFYDTQQVPRIVAVYLQMKG